MAGELTGTFSKPFKEAVAAFRLRLGNLVPTAKWDDIWQDQHDRAFMVAGATKADLLADLAGAVDKAISQGTSLEEFRRDFRRIVEDRGWHGWTGEGTKGGEAWRTRVIYRTNMRTSYAAGRMAQLVEGGFTLWVYRHGGSVEPRLIHLGWDGLVLPPDHPFWATHAPPNGWGCSCYVVGARSFAGAQRLGGQPGKPLPDGWQRLDPKTGAPVGIDKGWAYAPGRSVADETSAAVRLALQKIASLPPQLGSDLGSDHHAQIEEDWPRWLESTRSGEGHRPGLAGVLGQDVISALSARGIAPSQAGISVKPGLLSGPKAVRHDGAGDALTEKTWANLPKLLQKPKAVLLDEKSGRLIYIIEDDLGASQLAVAIDYSFSADRAKNVTNMVVSAYRPKIPALLARIGAKLLSVLAGGLS